MISTVLADALRRLDALLARVCDAEEQRARRLYTVERGWDSLRATLEPAAGELAFDARLPEAPLCPAYGPPALLRYRDAIGLSAVETDALFVLLAPYLEPRYSKLYLVLQDDVPGSLIAERVLFTILGRTPARAAALVEALAEDGRLVATGLVAPAPGMYAPRARPIDLAPDVRDALLGVSRPRSVAGVGLAWGAGCGELAGGEIHAVVGHGARDEVVDRLAGPLVVRAQLDAAAATDSGALRALWRTAIAHGATLVLDVGELERGAGLTAARALSALVARHGGAAIVTSPAPLPLAMPQHEAPQPRFVDRRAQWRDAAHARGTTLDDGALDRLAANHRLDRAQIDRLFRIAGAGDAPALAAAAYRLHGGAIRHASPVELGRTFADLVLRDSSKEALERLIYFVAHRDRIADAQGLDARFRLRRGPVVLFSGRSGTGKTLAAEVVAGAVGRPLFTVDLSQLVSKYIGETEKHIDEVLRGGERAGAVLFFDEADAMFSSRTDVSTSNDRYANLEVGYLLQRIEQHDGLVILATNLNQSIDEAFLRRFHARIEFPFPEPGERRRIWEIMLAGTAAGVDLERIARQRLAGGDIRNAALKAIFLAAQDGGPIDQATVERAVALELYELGRLSRRALQSDDIGSSLRALTEALELLLERELRQRFWKEIHLIHGAPTKETLAGKRPAASLAIYRLATNGDGGLRIGLIVSAWSQHAGEEHELLGVLLELMSRARLSQIAGRKASLSVQKSFDFDLLHRFWSSHGHPMRPSLVVDVEIG
ncbi:MAG TPA: ATP-binding protein [Kofleriaceae bacterium]|nr:ATP-binding protein [Kofleriaceae bacterium]